MQSGFVGNTIGNEDGLETAVEKRGKYSACNLKKNQIERPTIIIKIKIHSSCDIEDFVETHLCKLCVILRSRALRVVCPH